MKKTEPKYRAVLRDVAQLIVGELVSETKDIVTLSRPSLVNVAAGNGSVNLQFIPMELVSLNPPILIKALVEDDFAEDPFEVSFRKDQLLQTDVKLKDNIIEGYANSLKPSTLAVPQGAGGLVGPNGAPLTDEVPKIQNLF